LANFKQVINKEKPALIILLKLLILLCLIKTIFFIYNYNLYKGWGISSFSQVLKVLLWSLYYDIVLTCIVALPAILATFLRPISKLLLWITITAAVLMLLLNCVDIFYFPFHHQRADSDLLYVFRNPLQYENIKIWLITIAIVFVTVFVSSYFFKSFTKLLSSRKKPWLTLAICCIAAASLLINKNQRIIPTSPLISVETEQLPLTQNSLHTFLYSLYRNKESTLPKYSFMNDSELNKYFSIHKQPKNVSPTSKNIVLFIMESVPFEFFDTSNKSRPALPFLDSLIQHSTFYNNAFSFSYTSNKGITAILSGIPTIVDIPLYHSGYTNIIKTSIGKSLAKKDYTSSFYIGDNYDDFGFAKCAKWLGFDKYNSMEKIDGYKKLQKHTMGLHDEYVLAYMEQQMQKTSIPFFNCFYNISTHYPNDLPDYFKKQTQQLKIPAPYKSMLYYDQCLKNFFRQIASESWFSNTVFIFCSDHWASPDYSSKEDKVNSFRIPIFIYDPSVNKKQTISNTVSQLDIMNTVLAYAGVKDSIISYGNSLTDATFFANRTVFTKRNDAVYQAINNEYVLGLNADNGKVLYCYNYKNDIERKQNLWPSKNATIDTLAMEIKAFLQTAYNQYKSK